MIKALLIAIAAFIVVDAVAWHGVVRTQVVHQLAGAISHIADLQWKWL